MCVESGVAARRDPGGHGSALHGEQPHALTIPLRAKALETQVVVPVRPDLPVVLKAGLPLLTGMAEFANLFRSPLDDDAHHCALRPVWKEVRTPCPWRE
jgi:hypothetical protein